MLMTAATAITPSATPKNNAPKTSPTRAMMGKNKAIATRHLVDFEDFSRVVMNVDLDDEG